MLFQLKVDGADGKRHAHANLHRDTSAVVGEPYVEVRGPLDKGKLEAVERRLKAAVGRGANLLILQLEAEGGETKHVASTAQVIRAVTDDQAAMYQIQQGLELGSYIFLRMYEDLHRGRARRWIREVVGPHSWAVGRSVW